MPQRVDKASPLKAAKTAVSAPVQDKLLEKMGLVRDIDLALHLPLRYEDETRIVKLADSREGDEVQIEAEVIKSEVVYRPRRQFLVEVNDGSDNCTLRFFSFYPSHLKSLAVGKRIRARGELKGGFLGWVMIHPAFRPAVGDLPKAMTPIYPTVAGLPQHVLRKAVQQGLSRADLSDTFSPGDLSTLNSQALWTLRDALHFLHQPKPDVALFTLLDHSHPAWQRLKAEELLAQQISQLAAKRERTRLRAPMLKLAPLEPDEPNPVPHADPRIFLPHAETKEDGSALLLPLYEGLLKRLPFALTAAQERVVAEIARDMSRMIPMHRLLQGDVGAGKTVVAALAAAICIDAGWQCALMAPTEILAEQHFTKLIDWLEPLGVTTAWLTGSQKTRQRKDALTMIESGEAQLVVGTHAVIQEKVLFRNLALTIIDEQHRFGVAQRLALRAKLRHESMEPHMLMMTATPIPRTLAMSYYADLDVSTIDELPPGRTPVVTKLVQEKRRNEVIERILQHVQTGQQVYWVCPLIEESEVLDLNNATETHGQLLNELKCTRIKDDKEVRVGLLHSRMPTDEKKEVMRQFVCGDISVLVSTTVIEVGVDVPNASLMVIEHAERFGLSQLHQLRGRVGRGKAASTCVLLYSTNENGRLNEGARARLKAMGETSDGFEIARRDLEIRGPGEFLGARQSGEAMLRFADLSTDTALLDWARKEAHVLLDHHPALAEKHVARWLGGKSDFLKA